MNPNLKFKQLRKALSLSQTELAEKIGVSQGTITDIERGRIGVSKRVIKKIINGFGIKEEQLQGINDNSNNELTKNNTENLQVKNAGRDAGMQKSSNSFPEDYFNENNFYLKHNFEKKLILDIIANYPEINALDNDLHTLKTFEYMIKNFNHHYFDKFERQYHSAEKYYVNGKFNYEKYREDYFQKLKELDIIKPALSNIAMAIMQFYKEFEPFDTENIIKEWFAIPKKKEQ